MPEEANMRILITGGRNRITDADRADIWAALDRAAEDATTAVTVVHGACRSGADRWADQWARKQPNAEPDPHPAPWAEFGKAAGAMRNSAMVRLGADLCLAFPDAGSVGTWDCVRKARKANIPTVVHRRPDNPARRIQRRRTAGWRLPLNAVDVGRPSPYGNPFPVTGQRHVLQAVHEHRQWLDGNGPDWYIYKDHTYSRWVVLDGLPRLQGYDMTCWCPPGPCHADTLLRLANPEPR